MALDAQNNHGSRPEGNEASNKEVSSAPHPEGARRSHPPPHPASEAPDRSLVGQQLNVPPRPGAEAPAKPPRVSDPSGERIMLLPPLSLRSLVTAGKGNSHRSLSLLLLLLF